MLIEPFIQIIHEAAAGLVFFYLGQVRVEVDGHVDVIVPKIVLSAFDVNTCVIQGGCIGVTKVVRQTRENNAFTAIVIR